PRRERPRRPESATTGRREGTTAVEPHGTTARREVEPHGTTARREEESAPPPPPRREPRVRFETVTLGDPLGPVAIPAPSPIAAPPTAEPAPRRRRPRRRGRRGPPPES